MRYYYLCFSVTMSHFCFSSESMAVREAVLSQSPEFKEARIRAYSNASAVYDLLTVALVRWGQVDLLSEVKYQTKVLDVLTN